MNNSDIFDRVSEVLQVEFGPEWNIHIGKPRTQENGFVASLYMEPYPSNKIMPPMEREYRDRCHRAGLEEEWIYNTTILDGEEQILIGWDTMYSTYPITFRELYGNNLTRVTVKDLRRLGYSGQLNF